MPDDSHYTIEVSIDTPAEEPIREPSFLIWGRVKAQYFDGTNTYDIPVSTLKLTVEETTYMIMLDGSGTWQFEVQASRNGTLNVEASVTVRFEDHPPATGTDKKTFTIDAPTTITVDAPSRIVSPHDIIVLNILLSVIINANLVSKVQWRLGQESGFASREGRDWAIKLLLENQKPENDHAVELILYDNDNKIILHNVVNISTARITTEEYQCDEPPPALLFPLRLETRYLGENQEDLWIRIYPDQVFLDTFEPTLTPAELRAGQKYWEVVNGSEEEMVRQSAWRKLAGDFGPKRAAWIIRTSKNAEENHPVAKEGEIPFSIPKLRTLPKRFIAFPYTSPLVQEGQYSSELILREGIRGNDIRAGLLALPLRDPVTYEKVDKGWTAWIEGTVLDKHDLPVSNLQVKLLRQQGNEAVDTTSSSGIFKIPLLENEKMVDLEIELDGEPCLLRVSTERGKVTIIAQKEYIRSRWMTDLHQADADGMAICWPGAGNLANGVGKLIVIGFREEDPEVELDELNALLDGHHHSSGLGFLPYGTPTNNTEKGRSGYSHSREDLEKSYQVEVVGAAHVGNILAKTRSEKGNSLEDIDLHPQNNAQCLGAALGLGENLDVLQNLAHAERFEESLSQEMRIVLWPLIEADFLDGLFRDLDHQERLLTGQDVKRQLREHFAKWVKGAGPLPALRLGKQPYGILPATNFPEWHPWTGFEIRYFPKEGQGEDVLNGRIPAVASGNHPQGIEIRVQYGLIEKRGRTDSSGRFSIDVPGAEAVLLSFYFPEAMHWRLPVKPKEGEVEIVFPEPASEFDANLLTVLTALYEQWIQMAYDENEPSRIPRIKPLDPDNPDLDPDIIQSLMMSPVSTDYHLRPFVRKGFVDWMVGDGAQASGVLDDFRINGSYVVEVGPIDPMFDKPDVMVRGWKTGWEREKGREGENGGLKQFWEEQELWDNRLLNSFLFNLFGWWNGKDVSSLVQKTDEGNEPLSGISSNDPRAELLCILSGNSDEEGKPTLFYYLLNRAKATGDPRVTKAITNLVSTTVLYFLNTANTAQAIVQAVKGDPRKQLPLGAVGGIQHALAEKIVATRDALPGGVFNSIDQVRAIPGLDDDVLDDLFFSCGKMESNPDLDRFFRETLDLFSHRLDAWITSMVTQRLAHMRQTTPKGIHLGAYGMVENLRPDRDKRESYGYIHAPSREQAAAGAVLYNAYLAHSGTEGQAGRDPYRLSLSSERVRRGKEILDGIRHGQYLGAILGFQFERGLHERSEQDPTNNLDQYIDEFRREFPIEANSGAQSSDEAGRETVAARNVVDGLALAIAWEEKREGGRLTAPNAKQESKLDDIIEGSEGLQAELDNLLAGLDGVSDLLLYESVYQGVRGNYDRAAASMNAMSGTTAPNQIESILTLVSTRTFSQRVCWLFPPASLIHPGSNDPNAPKSLLHPRQIAEPRIDAWFASLVEPLDQISCGYEFQSPRINLNDCSENELKAIPGMESTAAGLVLTQRNRIGLFRSWADFEQIEGISAINLKRLQRWGAISHSKGEPSTYDRIDVNTAGQAELELVFDTSTASAILKERTTKAKPFYRLADLTRAGVTNVDALRPFITTGVTSVSVPELRLSAADLFYLSAHLPQGEATEIEKRIAFFVRREFSLPYDNPVKLDFSVQPESGLSFRDALYLGNQLFQVLGKAMPLTPQALCLDSQAYTAPYTSADADELRKRFLQIEAAMKEFSANLGPEDFPHAPGQPDLPDQLHRAGDFGIFGAIPAGVDEPELMPRRVAVVRELRKRLKAAGRLYKEAFPDEGEDKLSPLEPAQKIGRLQKAIKTLLGQEFIVLPTFSLPQQHNTNGITPAGSIVDAFGQQDGLLNGQGSKRIRFWLQEAAPVYPPLAEVENVHLLLEALSTDQRPLENALSLHVAQLPFREYNRWLALSDEERGNHPISQSGKGEALSVVSLFSGSPAQFQSQLTGNGNGEQPGPLAGLLIHQWNEQIPFKTVTTSLCFNYNAPNTQPPQAWLLAVPAERGKAWTLENLAAIAANTLDMARIRAVDNDAMSTRGISPSAWSLFSPGWVMPVNQNAREDSLEKTALHLVIEDFLARLEAKPETPGWSPGRIVGRFQDFDPAYRFEFDEVINWGDVFVKFVDDVTAGEAVVEEFVLLGSGNTSISTKFLHFNSLIEIASAKKASPFQNVRLEIAALPGAGVLQATPTADVLQGRIWTETKLDGAIAATTTTVRQMVNRVGGDQLHGNSVPLFSIEISGAEFDTLRFHPQFDAALMGVSAVLVT